MTGSSACSVGPGGQNLVFVVGAPRSGTSWLQRLLGAHEQIATAQETGLINEFCAPLYSVWSEQLPPDPTAWLRQRHRGLPAVLTRAEMDEAVRDFATTVYEKVLSLKPTATVVVDKNPAYCLHLPLIGTMFPAARVIHIVRDGRDVVDSMLAASRGWGGAWAPRELAYAATTWQMFADAVSQAGGAPRQLVVRYEALREEGAVVLRECFDFIGVRTTSPQCDAIVNRFRLGDTSRDDSLLWSGEVMAQRGAAPEEPAGFEREGARGAWRDSWSRRDRVEFDRVAGSTLIAYGYELSSSWVGTPVGRAVAFARARARRWASALGWRLHMALGRHGWYVHVARIEPYGDDS